MAGKKTRLKFSIPYNGDIELIEWALNFDDIYEVYFQGPSGLDHSDPYEGGFKGAFSKKAIVSLAQLCKKRHIRTNILSNKSVMFFEKLDRFSKFIQQNLEIIDSITVTDPFTIMYFRDNFPGIELQSSVYMGIDTAYKVRKAVEMGLSTIGVPPHVNMNKTELEGMIKLKKQYKQLSIKLLATHACFNNCMFYGTHSHLPIFQEVISRNSEDHSGCFGESLNAFQCFYPITDNADYIKRPVIRPEDIGYYEENGLADYMKIAFRNESSEILKEKIRAYMERSYRGDLFKILPVNTGKNISCDNSLIPKDFLKRLMECDNNCAECDFCDRVAAKALREE